MILRALRGSYERERLVALGAERPAQQSVRVVVLARTRPPHEQDVLKIDNDAKARFRFCLQILNVAPFPVTLTQVTMRCQVYQSGSRAGSGVAKTDEIIEQIRATDILVGGEYRLVKELAAPISTEFSKETSQLDISGHLIVDGPWGTFPDRVDFQGSVWMPTRIAHPEGS